MLHTARVEFSFSASAVRGGQRFYIDRKSKLNYSPFFPDILGLHSVYAERVMQKQRLLYIFIMAFLVQLYISLCVSKLSYQVLCVFVCVCMRVCKTKLSFQVVHITSTHGSVAKYSCIDFLKLKIGLSVF